MSFWPHPMIDIIHERLNLMLPWVPETFHAWFPVSVKSLRRSVGPAASRHRREKTPGTQGNLMSTYTGVTPLYLLAGSHKQFNYHWSLPSQFHHLMPTPACRHPVKRRHSVPNQNDLCTHPSWLHWWHSTASRKTKTNKKQCITHRPPWSYLITAPQEIGKHSSKVRPL